MKKIRQTSELEELEKDFSSLFDDEDKAREQALKLSREITRFSSQAIKNIHHLEFKQAKDFLVSAEKSLKNAKNILVDFPEIRYAGFIHNAEKELIEGLIFYTLIMEDKIYIPDFNEFDYISYLHGLSEAMGELRRYILDRIRKNEVDNLEYYLSLMDDVYYFLTSFDYPDALTRGLRRSVDVLRSLIEKTRSEITLVLQHKSLEERLKCQ